MDPKKSWAEYWEWADKMELDDPAGKLYKIYEKYDLDAFHSGIDWDNDPPPLEILDERLCLMDVRNEPLHLGKIPVEFRTANVCYAAVYLDDDALQFVPENLREEVKTWKDAITVKQWLTELGWYDCQHSSLKLTKKLLTPELCRDMVKANGCTYCLLPEGLKTPELLELAKKNIYKFCGYDNPPPVKREA
jgi:hypothetical protein